MERFIDAYVRMDKYDKVYVREQMKNIWTGLQSRSWNKDSLFTEDIIYKITIDPFYAMGASPELEIYCRVNTANMDVEVICGGQSSINNLRETTPEQFAATILDILPVIEIMES